MNKYERKKRFFILLWVVSCSFVLWSMSMVDMRSFDPGSFLWFTIFFLGAGLTYHFLTEMLRTPITLENDVHWNASIKYAVCSVFIVLSVAAVALFEKNIYNCRGILTFISLFLAIFIIPRLAEKAIKVFPKADRR